MRGGGSLLVSNFVELQFFSRGLKNITCLEFNETKKLNTFLKQRTKLRFKLRQLFGYLPDIDLLLYRTNYPINSRKFRLPEPSRPRQGDFGPRITSGGAGVPRVSFNSLRAVLADALPWLQGACSRYDSHSLGLLSPYQR